MKKGVYLLLASSVLLQGCFESAESLYEMAQAKVEVHDSEVIKSRDRSLALGDALSLVSKIESEYPDSDVAKGLKSGELKLGGLSIPEVQYFQAKAQEASVVYNYPRMMHYKAEYEARSIGRDGDSPSSSDLAEMYHSALLGYFVEKDVVGGLAFFENTYKDVKGRMTSDMRRADFDAWMGIQKMLMAMYADTDRYVEGIGYVAALYDNERAMNRLLKRAPKMLEDIKEGRKDKEDLVDELAKGLRNSDFSSWSVAMAIYFDVKDLFIERVGYRSYFNVASRTPQLAANIAPMTKEQIEEVVGDETTAFAAYEYGSFYDVPELVRAVVDQLGEKVTKSYSYPDSQYYLTLDEDKIKALAAQSGDSGINAKVGLYHYYVLNGRYEDSVVAMKEALGAVKALSFEDKKRLTQVKLLRDLVLGSWYAATKRGDKETSEYIAQNGDIRFEELEPQNSHHVNLYYKYRLPVFAQSEEFKLAMDNTRYAVAKFALMK